MISYSTDLDFKMMLIKVDVDSLFFAVSLWDAVRCLLIQQLSAYFLSRCFSFLFFSILLIQIDLLNLVIVSSQSCILITRKEQKLQHHIPTFVSYAQNKVAIPNN